jgi:hypothetical protein
VWRVSGSLITASRSHFGALAIAWWRRRSAGRDAPEPYFGLTRRGRRYAIHAPLPPIDAGQLLPRQPGRVVGQCWRVIEARSLGPCARPPIKVRLPPVRMRGGPRG